MNRTIEIAGHRRGLHEITREVTEVVRDAGAHEAVCTVFVQHTSAGICIQENADPSARRDMEAWLDRVAPEGEPWYTHVDEGLDDMPSHLKAILTGTAVSIPVIASGGVGTLEHLVEGARDGHASAVLAASIFHFGEHSLGEAKAHMAAAGVPVRPVAGEQFEETS